MAHSGINVLLEGHNFARLLGGLWTTVWIAALSLLIDWHSARCWESCERLRIGCCA